MKSKNIDIQKGISNRKFAKPFLVKELFKNKESIKNLRMKTKRVQTVNQKMAFGKMQKSKKLKLSKLKDVTRFEKIDKKVSRGGIEFLGVDIKNERSTINDVGESTNKKRGLNNRIHNDRVRNQIKIKKKIDKSKRKFSLP